MKKLLLGMGMVASTMVPLVVVVSCGDITTPSLTLKGTSITPSTGSGFLIASAVEPGATLLSDVNIKASSDEEVTFTFKVTKADKTIATVVLTKNKNSIAMTIGARVSTENIANNVFAKIDADPRLKEEAKKQMDALEADKSSTGEAFMPHWSSTLPSTIYKKVDGSYSTVENDAVDYKVAVGGKVKALPAMPTIGQTIYINDHEYTATASPYSYSSLPSTLYRTSTGYTTDKTKATGYMASVPEVHPTMGGVELSSISGGTSENMNGWTWGSTDKQEVSSVNPVVAVSEVKPTVAGIFITGAIGGEAYDSQQWTWKVTKLGSERVPLVAAVKDEYIPSYSGLPLYDFKKLVDHSVNPMPPTGEPEGAGGLYSAGFDNGESSEKPSINGQSIDNLPGRTLYDIGKWTWSRYSVGSDAIPEIPMVKTEYTAFYKNTKITSITKEIDFGAPVPIGEPAQKPVYMAGVHSVDAVSAMQGSNEYIASYEGVEMPSTKVTVKWTLGTVAIPSVKGPMPTGKPAMGNVYVEGVAAEAEHIPTVVTVTTPSASALTVVIDDQVYTATRTIEFHDIPQGTLYESKTDHDKYTNVESKATEYVAAHSGTALTSSEISALKGTGTADASIVISGVTYTYTRVKT